MDSHIETITLTRMKYAMSAQINNDLIVDSAFDLVHDFYAPRYKRFLATFIVYGEEFEPITHEHRYPKDWWQAFKSAHFPAWAKRRWPVQYRHVKWKVTPKHIYANIRPPHDLGQEHYSMMKIDTSFGGWNDGDE